jgi:antitoxin FitA
MSTNPIVRNVDEETAQSIQDLEALIGRGVSPEHRAILLAALTQTSGRSFNRLLSSMPNVGEDSDFERSRG